MISPIARTRVCCELAVISIRAALHSSPRAYDHDLVIRHRKVVGGAPHVCAGQPPNGPHFFEAK
jgi:hypothetical protein